MSKKDYKILVEALKQSRPGADGKEVTVLEFAVWRKCVNSIAYAMQYDNPRFNALKFINACREK